MKSKEEDKDEYVSDERQRGPERHRFVGSQSYVDGRIVYIYDEKEEE